MTLIIKLIIRNGIGMFGLFLERWEKGIYEKKRENLDFNFDGKIPFFLGNEFLLFS